MEYPLVKHRSIPAELFDEMSRFVPGLFCRKMLSKTNSIFYLLFRCTKREKRWKIEDLEAREANATYVSTGHSPRIIRPLIPRLGKHRKLTSFGFVHDHELINYCYVGANERRFIVSLLPSHGHGKAAIREHFTEGALNEIEARFSVGLTFHPLPLHIPWDVCMVTFFATFGAWDGLMSEISDVLNEIYAPPSPPPPADSASEME
ncbi:hypothetical protein niasHT_037430 [Heterodera trifolii]|uniref:Uncharacterized protein n=1 Tax=Heterodera trifolii TaxID=157864 RepID=A0ABD2J0R1_9BILA